MFLFVSQTQRTHFRIGNAMRKLISLFFLIVVDLEIGATNKWCKPNLCRGQHILCNDKGKFQSTCPSRATAMVKMTPDIIKIIVDTHNDYRNKFAGGLHSYPRAARMATLRWDPELAKVADALVRQCRTYDDDDCVKTPKYEYADASYHMQKYYCMSTKKNVLRKQLADWIDPTNQENVVMLYLNSDKKDIEYSQHFFQVLRDRANRLGCAIIEFIRPSLVHQLLKCVYNCGVTIATDEFNPVYEVTGGNAASNCTKGANKVYQYLCHKNEPVKNCDGGDLFAPTDEEKDEEPNSTEFPLPKYEQDSELPPIPDYEYHYNDEGEN
ncbi:antigen 5 like allergen Cul n 1 isoform X1 [Drosophila ficusphila]|uniref:antigen 5 like allergen Cul n 1 isoform X1 n=2 Tax=Drosophila ficusphila TaxID=30025 RepID=UPI001C890E4E|nr:antigen 5 like allergen Cul n 1 isoform X1 [Drosophila ficusphila]